jgi:hypothetical protein
MAVPRQHHQLAAAGDHAHELARLDRQQFVTITVEQQQRPPGNRPGHLAAG